MRGAALGRGGKGRECVVASLGTLATRCGPPHSFSGWREGCTRQRRGCPPCVLWPFPWEQGFVQGSRHWRRQGRWARTRIRGLCCVRLSTRAGAGAGHGPGRRRAHRLRHPQAGDGPFLSLSLACLDSGCNRLKRPPRTARRARCFAHAPRTAHQTQRPALCGACALVVRRWSTRTSSTSASSPSLWAACPSSSPSRCAPNSQRLCAAATGNRLGRPPSRGS